jgi:hypothetical protein
MCTDEVDDFETKKYPVVPRRAVVEHHVSHIVQCS